MTRRKKNRTKQEWHFKEGYYSWDTPAEEILGPDYKIKQERFYRSLAKFTKDPDSPEIVGETLRLAEQANLDMWPEVIMPGDPSADRTYYENLLKGERNTDHYLTVAKEIYGQGYVEDAIAYLNKGIDQLRPSRFSEIVFLKYYYEIGKIYIGADELLTAEITKAASCDIDLLIEGETGTGKEMVAREIHSRSRRKHGEFFPISCATLVPTLLGSELFGHVKGAFTDAKISSPGIFRAAAANHGTVFLDELDSLDRQQQPILLRFLQEREIRPVGSQKTEKVDLRVLCATNKNVLEMVNRGEMRADLYYRIGIFTISLLPLRNKKWIIPDLVHHFIEKHKPERQKLITVTQAAMELLQTHPWPGNIRELENLIRVVVTTTDTETITPDHLKFYLKRSSPIAHSLAEALSERWTQKELIAKYQKLILAECGGNKTQAAKVLGIDRTTLNKQLEENTSDIFDD